MTLKDISISYGSCANCGNASCLGIYYQRTIHTLQDLKSLVHKKCMECDGNLRIKRIKVNVGVGGLK